MAAGNSLRILHVTDLHLRAAPEGELYGVRTNASFAAVMEHALGDPAWQPDAVLVTGDIAEDPAPAVYADFRARMERLGVPVLCLPGNHDEPGAMARALD